MAHCLVLLYDLEANKRLPQLCKERLPKSYNEAMVRFGSCKKCLPWWMLSGKNSCPSLTHPE